MKEKFMFIFIIMVIIIIIVLSCLYVNIMLDVIANCNSMEY